MVSRTIAKLGMYTAGFMAVANVSVMYLALPRIESTLGAGIADQQWILSIYPLMQGGFTLAGGTLGDLYGRKRILAIGTWLFLIASLACAFAPSAGSLIVGRAVQGIAAAPLLSLPLAILIDILPDPSRNARTVKNFATVAGLAAGVAPLLGGILVKYCSWPAVFYFSAALSVIVLVGVLFAKESNSAAATQLDAGGQILSVTACLAFTFALIEGNAAGWSSPAIITAFGMAAAALTLFITAERRTANPMVNLRYFGRRLFDASLLTLGIVNFAWYGVTLLCTLFLQHVLGQDAVLSGLYLMPCNAAYFGINLLSNRIARHLGIAASTVLSFAVTLAGIAWLATLGVSSAPWQVAAGLTVTGAGWGLICTPATALGMSAVKISDEGFASGTLALSRSIFGVFGIAVLGSLLAGVISHGVGEPLKHLVHHGRIFEAASSRDLRSALHASYVSGFRLALEACFAVTLLGGAAIIAALSERQPSTLARSESSS